MYCNKCGKQNPEKSKFCQHCGVKFNENLTENSKTEGTPTANYINIDSSPYPYVISIWKLVIMSLTTFGIYEIYWFYKQWKSFNEENKLDHGSFAIGILALFSPLTSYSLFKHVSNDVKDINKGKGIDAGGLAVMYFFLIRFLFGFLPLIFVQNAINLFWEKKYGDKLVRSSFGLGNWIVVISVVLILTFFVYSGEASSTDTSTTLPEQAPNAEGYNQEEIASSVVNIFCPSTVRGEETSGGSGTIITETGVILTNSHIIPQDKNELHVDDTGCMVVLPDPETGQPKEVYLATPFVIPGLSDDYDLAFMSIYDAYYDEDQKEYQGVYPRKFPAFDDTTRCSNDNLKLGEQVRIFGYPAISGGYSLTITDGLVSSFPGAGMIVTSAKISHGNSGGLAVDKDGCMVGVPSMVSSDEAESLGVIYSMDLVNEFSAQVTDFLNKDK